MRLAMRQAGEFLVTKYDEIRSMTIPLNSENAGENHISAYHKED
jgi:hypothetical protein